MTNFQLKQLLSRFELHDDSLTGAEYDELRRYLETRSDVVREILDGRAIDGLLELLAADAADEERFVNACLDKLNTRRPPSIPGPFPVIQVNRPEHASASFKNIYKPVKPAEASINRRRNVQLWLSIAAVILIALGTWSGFVWLKYDASDKALVTSPSLPNPASRQFDETPPRVIADSLVESRKAKDETERALDEHPGRGGGHFNSEVEKDSLAIVDVLKTDSEDIDEVARRSEMPNEVDVLDPQTDAVRQPFATVSTGKNGIWAGENPGERVGAGKLKLLRGNASVDLGNGTLIRILAPAEFELIRHDYLRLQNGSYFVDLPRSADGIEIETSVGVLQAPASARLQLIVDATEGLETLVSRGQIDFIHTHTDGYQDRIELSKNHLSQFVIRPISDHPIISPVIMSRGKNEFRGQIGSGKDAVKTESPLIFANVVGRVSKLSNAIDPRPDVTETWRQFARDYQALDPNVDSPEFSALLKRFLGHKEFSNPLKNVGDASGNGTTDFQGSLSMNGIERKFNSREEYEKARQEWFHDSSLQGIPNEFRNLIPSGNFEGDVNLNGRPLEFSSPDKFKSLRKQMSR